MKKKPAFIPSPEENMKSHFDVGIYGWWGHDNYGGCLTYFALERAVRKLGYSVLMIQEPFGYPGRYKIPDTSIAMRHAIKYYHRTPQLDKSELGQLNQICDRFLVGGDQMWNYLIHFVKNDCFLDFVADDKLKLSYSTSFGHVGHNPPSELVHERSPLLKRFDAISVRENYAVDIAKNTYGAKATSVIDAVFLLKKKDYLEVAEDADFKFPKKFLLAFILNPSIEKRDQILEIAKAKGLEPVFVSDAADMYYEKFDEIFAGCNVMRSRSIANFIKGYNDAEYIVTDSFHGTCMCYVFRKNFSVYFNEIRGSDRFVSLMNILKQDSRRIYDNRPVEEILANESLYEKVDWREADRNVEALAAQGYDWLKKALSMEKTTDKYPSSVKEPEVERLHSNFDFIKIRLLGTLLKDYGIKHVVLSPGGRDVPIIRFFEHNENHFILHRVTDERSAAYFAMGLAAQLKKPVACVCTSGTAASNYLPAVTEAYYTGIPLVVITADRYGIYLNHGEDQTIPQKDIYRDVVKMSVSLPEAGGYLAEYQARRDISTCILEATHNGWGPVHINVPVNDIAIGSRVHGMHWSVLPMVHPHIQIVGFENGETDMYRWVDSLKRSPRILVVYGQTPPMNEEQKRDVERFAEKYNCVIVKDTISNINSPYVVEPYNMLNRLTQAEFDSMLSPDIVISVGGKRLMNDPLTFKIRGGKGIRHWSVTPDGKVKDFYFKLSSVIECTQYQFFKWFADKAGDIKNDGNYLNAWRKLIAERPANKFEGYNAHYVQSRLLPAIPSGSMLHLGIGQSFIDVRRYTLQPDVEVFCNMGTNGIDGCTSTFMGQCAIERERLAVLLVGDLSFFYDMNSIWNKTPAKNARILLVNNNGSGLLRGHNLKAVTSVHNTQAEGWVRSTGTFEYIRAESESEFDEKLNYFLSDKPEKPVFFEVICN